MSPKLSQYRVEDSVTLTAIPSSAEYVFLNWTGNVDGITDPSQNPVTFIIGDSRNITANFAPSDIRCAIVAASNASVGGLVVIDPNQSDYSYNQTVSLKAVANEGYVFSGWTGDLTGASPRVTLRANGNKVVTAIFDPTVTIVCDPLDAGTITLQPPPTSSGGYPAGMEVIAEAATADGYKFVSWGGAVSGYERQITITVDSPKAVRALFVKESTFRWWWIAIGILLFLSGVIALRLAYVAIRRRSEDT